MSDPRFVVVARFYLDSSTQNISNIRVTGPWDYEARVLKWGYVERSISIPISLQRIGDAVIRIADTDRDYRNLFAIQAGRRRFVEIKILEEGTSESATDPIYRGVVTNTTFGPGYCEISLQDVTNAWIDETIPAVINRVNYPSLAPGLDGAFFPIVNGICSSPTGNASPADNLQGVIALPHIGFDAAVGDRYAAAIHPIEDIVVYRSLPGEDFFSVVDADEYVVTEEAKVFAEFPSLSATPTYIDFLVEQPDGTKIRADIWGINFRGEWNGIAAATTFEENRNPINFFINMIYLIMAKAGVDDDAWEVSTIEAVLDKFETMIAGPSGGTRFNCDGAIVREMTAREWLGAFCSNFEIDFYQQKNGKLAIAYVEDTNPSRPLFTAGHDVEINSFYEQIANPTVNQCRYHFEKNYATDEYASHDIFDNTYDQYMLGDTVTTPSGTIRVPRVETEDFRMDYVRDPETALFVINRRMNYMALGSFRQTWNMDLPETIDDLELATLIGLTHFDGVALGGYVNTELKVLGLTLDLDRMKVSISTIRLVPAVITDDPDSFRPTTYIERQADNGYEWVSQVADGDLAIDNDLPIGASTTFATLTLVQSSPFANYAQLFLTGFPEPDSGRTLSTATIYVRARRTNPGAPTLDAPSAFIGIYNEQIVEEFFDNEIVNIVGSVGNDDEIALHDFSHTFNAASFASNFPGGAADIWVLCAQWQTVHDCYGTFYIYDCWIHYEYA